jgi:hypothetical protein
VRLGERLDLAATEHRIVEFLGKQADIDHEDEL